MQHAASAWLVRKKQKGEKGVEKYLVND